MTPVRVRGKRGQKARLRALQEQSMQRAPSEELETVPGPALSRLERLPTEVLERIFLFSQNVAMPQASLTLGKALSSTYVKYRLLRALFTDECMEDLPLIDEFRIAKLQTNLLRCRWVDLPSIKRAVAASVTSLLALLLGKPTEIFSAVDLVTLGIPNALAGTGCPLQELSTAELSRFVDDVFSSPIKQRRLTWSFLPKTQERWVDIDANRGIIRMSHSPFIVYKLELRPGCEMPTRLLHGPWTTSKKEFLEFLMSTQAAIDPEYSNNQEVAAESLKEAIVQGDVSVATLLTDSWHLGSSRRKYRLPLSEEHVRLAIFDGGCNREMINLLEVRSSSENIDWNQDDFVEWAIERKVRGDERGSWLLEKIEAHQKTDDRRRGSIIDYSVISD
ncbi:MAG: hypothetical protein Q9188_002281 [Gyalolechia gomerana]